MPGAIGTYKEKTLHRELKWHIEPSGALHEVPVGKYIADIKTDNEIIEIQTQSFYKLRDKLNAFLPENIVELVYPITREKLLVWVDVDGEILRTRRSPRKGTFYNAFRELYQIKSLLVNENLHVRLVLVDVSEKRTPEDETSRKIEDRANRRGSYNRRHGYTKIDTSIQSIYDEMTISCPMEYAQLIPATLDDGFTTAGFASAAGLSKYNAGIALNVLRHVGVVNIAGKSGRFYVYVRKNGIDNGKPGIL